MLGGTTVQMPHPLSFNKDQLGVLFYKSTGIKCVGRGGCTELWCLVAAPLPWQFEIAAAVTANMALHENQKGFFRGCFCFRVITDIQGA